MCSGKRTGHRRTSRNPPGAQPLAMCEAVEEAPPTRSLTRDQYNVAVQKEGRIDRPDWQLSEVPASKVRCRGA